MRKHGKMTIRMAYEMVMPYHLHMPSYFLETFTEYPDKIYTSYEAGSTKPDPGIFNYMIKDSKLNPAETIFVDDGAANIVIGKELGFITMQPENGEDWRQKLEKLL